MSRAICSAFLVCASLTFIVLLHLNTNAQETTNSGTTDAQIRKLQQDRVETLQRAVALALSQYQDGALDYRTVLVSQHNLLDAELDLAGTREDQIRVLASQLKIATRSLAFTKVKFRAGLVTQLDVLGAKSAKLRVDIELLRLRRRTK